MKPRRVLQVVVAVGTLVGPLAVVAHADLFGTVTTAPVGMPAPAMGMPLLVLLAVLLAGAGAYLLRRTGGGVIAKVAVVAALAALAGLAYANGGMGTIYTVAGPDCGIAKTFTFDPLGPNELLSNCPNPIRIIAIQLDCNAPDPPGECTVGQVLSNGQFCTLPECFM